MKTTICIFIVLCLLISNESLPFIPDFSPKRRRLSDQHTQNVETALQRYFCRECCNSHTQSFCSKHCSDHTPISVDDVCNTEKEYCSAAVNKLCDKYSKKNGCQLFASEMGSEPFKRNRILDSNYLFFEGWNYFNSLHRSQPIKQDSINRHLSQCCKEHGGYVSNTETAAIWSYLHMFGLSESGSEYTRDYGYINCKNVQKNIIGKKTLNRGDVCGLASQCQDGLGCSAISHKCIKKANSVVNGGHCVTNEECRAEKGGSSICNKEQKCQIYVRRPEAFGNAGIGVLKPPGFR